MTLWRDVQRFRRVTTIRVMRRFPHLNALLPAPAPLATVRFPLTQRRSAGLGILLPGIDDLPGDFARHGFIETAQRYGLPWDLIAVDSHYGYFSRGTVVERLHQDVVLPAQAADHRQVWLVGISLGGFGALLYAARHPERVAGLVLLAPFLGFPKTITAIRRAGGLAQWRPEPHRQDFQTELWQWLHGYLDPDSGLPPIWLGYGERDSFAAANRLLAELLRNEQVMVVPGGHDWTTWRLLWARLLATGFHCRSETA